MSWFGSGKKKHGGGSRREQLEGLSKVRGAKSNADETAWTIEVYTRTGVHKIYVDISPHFPTTPPLFRIDTRFTHRRADPAGVIMIAEIRNWTLASSLKSVANLVINEILADPPKPAGVGGAGSPSARASAGPAGAYRGAAGLVVGGARIAADSSGSGIGSGVGGGGGVGAGAIKPPAPLKREDSDLSVVTFSVPKDLYTMEEVKKLSDEQIRLFAKDDSALRDFAFECCHSLRDMKRSSQQAVLDMARENVSTKEMINQTDLDMAELREECSTLGQLFEQLRAKQQQIFQRKFSTTGIVTAFDKKLAELDEEGYALKRKLEDDEMTPVMYCRKLHELRTQYHLLTMKKEKYVELSSLRA